jgi:PAS domain S-box-containing protein
MNMGSPEERRDHENKLRRRAEDVLNGKPVDLDGLHKDDIQYLLQELQVHQAELSIQNEELRRVQLDLEVSRDLYSELYNFAPAGYCTLSQKGRILNANQTLAELLDMDREKLLHHPLSDFVDSADQDEYYLNCQRALKDHRRAVSEIRLVKRTGERMIVRMESVIARGDPTHLMVMLSDITDQRWLETQQHDNAIQMVIQRRLIENSEMERMELARNLHDGPVQGLASLGFSIQIIKEILKEHGVDGDANLQQMGDDIKNLIAELRSICNDLRPPVLSRLGLRRALQENAEELQAKYPLTRITLELSDDPTLLPDPISLSLYRIYQQAMNNINRHAKASEVLVRLKLDQSKILFEIQDNGQGISDLVDWDEYARLGHLGLVGMKERAEANGGTIQLLSHPGQGTTVRVIIPLGSEIVRMV